MHFVCVLCNTPFVVKSTVLAERIAKFKPVCDNCRRKNKTAKSIKSLNKGTQHEIMAFNSRLSKCEDKFSNIELIIETILNEKNKKLEKMYANTMQHLVDENIALNKRLTKQENLLFKLNNKLIKEK